MFDRDNYTPVCAAVGTSYVVLVEGSELLEEGINQCAQKTSVCFFSASTSQSIVVSVMSGQSHLFLDFNQYSGGGGLINVSYSRTHYGADT